MNITLPSEERRFFRDQLRRARAVALLDGEGFHPIVAALERLGVPRTEHRHPQLERGNEQREGLVIAVTLDDPKDGPAQDAVIRVIERAVLAGPQRFPIDVTFPGEGTPDPVDDWVSSSATPFYRRA